MLKSDFFYDLPENLIAQTPLEKRNNSRLMVLNKQSGDIIHSNFYNLFDFLHPGDTLILNDSRVIPARIYGTRIDTNSVVEFLLLKQINSNTWETLAGPGKKAVIGKIFNFGEELMSGEVIDITEEGNRIIKFLFDGNFFNILDKIGQMPLPPYITKKLENKERYQTVYSKDLGSAAAPTAGLHFTTQMLDDLRKNGINIGFVTLHVGLGTFRPVKADNIKDHHMHSEQYSLPSETAELINKTKDSGNRVIAVGTTACRTLESVFKKNNSIKEDYGETDIFIYPGFKFNVLDGLITNFHLPESTLIMLVSAFSGYDSTMNAYKIAVKEQYRFFSFGDAMLII